MHPISLLYLLSFLSLCYRSVIFVISLLSLLSSRSAKRLWASRPKLALSWSPNSTDLYFWYLFVDICQQTNTKDIAGQSASYLWDGELFWCMVIHYWWTDMLKVTHFQVKLDGEEPEQQSPTGGRCLENDWTNPVIFLYSSHLFLLPGCVTISMNTFGIFAVTGDTLKPTDLTLHHSLGYDCTRWPEKITFLSRRS